MKLFHTFFRTWLVALLAFLFIAFSNSVDAAQDDRLSYLQSLRESKPDRVIRLVDASFQQFFLSKDPRPYSLFVFFDAVQLHSNSDLQLPQLRREFAQVAQAHYDKFSDSGESSNVFFCDIEFGQSPNIFKLLGVNALPHVKLFPSGKAKDGDSMDFNSHGRSAEGFASFLRARTGVDIGPIETPPLISTTTALILLPLILIFVVFFLRWIFTRRTVFHDPRLWCAGALFIYFFSVSGGMHNIIRGMPMYIRDRQNPSKLIYFFQGSGTQLGVEGFTVGALYTIVGLLLAFATHYVPTIKSTTVQRLLMLFCIVSSGLCVSQVVSLDRWKTGYYVHAYWPNRWR